MEKPTQPLTLLELANPQIHYHALELNAIKSAMRSHAIEFAKHVLQNGEINAPIKLVIDDMPTHEIEKFYGELYPGNDTLPLT